MSSLASFTNFSPRDDEYLLNEVNNLILKQVQERRKEQMTERKFNKKSSTIIISPINSPKLRFSRRGSFNSPQLNFEKLNILENPDNLEKSTEELKESPIINVFDRVKNVIARRKNRFKLKTSTKEAKFNEKIKDFTKLETFLNVQPLLYQINLTNTIDQSKKSEYKQFSFPKLPLKNNTYISEEEETSPKEQKLNNSLIRSIKLLKEKVKKRESHLTNEEIFTKLPLSTRVTGYLNDYYKRKSFGEFEKNLMESLEDQDYKLRNRQNPRVVNFSISAGEKIEMNNLEKFAQQRLKENLIKVQLNSDSYFNEYRAQADKVLGILKKTTKKIYSKKSTEKKDVLNKIKSFDRGKKKVHSIDFSNLRKFNELSSYKNYSFITQNSIYKHSGASIHDKKEINSIERILPIINEKIRSKAKKQKTIKENENVRSKMTRFLIECDETKTIIKNSKSQDLKEINHIQEKSNRGFANLKGPSNIIESLITSIDENNQIFQKKLRKKGTYLSIHSILT